MPQIDLGQVVGPKGDQGAAGQTGATGATGATGPAGAGVPTGGSAGQVLKKHSSTNYDTEWKTLYGSDISMSGLDSTRVSNAIAGRKPMQTEVDDPTASGTSLSFISSISQNQAGKITPAKKSVPVANNLTTSSSGTAVLDAYQGKVIKESLDNKVSIFGGSATGPELNTLMINNVDSTSDVIIFGAGQERSLNTNNGGILYSHGNRQYIFRSKGTNTANANEDFKLPAHSNGSTNAEYDILTTKGFPFVRAVGSSPGGTTSGDNTNKITFTAPAALRHAIVCFADKMVNVYCNELTGTTVYSGTIPDGWTLTKSNATYTLTRTATTLFRYSILWI